MYLNVFLVYLEVFYLMSNLCRDKQNTLRVNIGGVEIVESEGVIFLFVSVATEILSEGGFVGGLLV